MIESELLRRIMLAASAEDARLFRNNTGLGWTGTLERIFKTGYALVRPGDVVLRNARPLHSGLCVGSSDLIGWTPRVIDSKRHAIFTAVEGKSKRGRLTEEQRHFLAAVHNAGGIAIEARDIDHVIRILKDN